MAGQDTQTTQTGGRAGPLLPELEPGIQVGRHVVLARLGSGGMGVVYEALDPDLDRRVAIKLLSSQLPVEDARARMVHEAKAMARLSHPCVVAVYEIGMFRDQVFLAMERIDGVTLREWLAAEPRSFQEIVAMFVQAGEGLAAAHDAGLVHRDFKPGNVLVDGARAKVMDFGVAAVTQPIMPPLRALPPEVDPADPAPPTEPDHIVGTPRYMAPELGEGINDARSDQYSFCVALYEALYEASPTPFGRRPQPDRAAAVPAWLERIVSRGLSKARDERYPSMRALLADLTVDEAAHREIAAVWGTERKAQVRAAFLAGERGRAADEWEQLAGLLDGYTDRLAALHVEAYREAREGGFSDAAELRLLCLAQRLHEVRSLVGLIEVGDADVIARAIEAVHRLSPLSDCDDVARFNVDARAPQREARSQVEAVGALIAQAAALRITGRVKEAMPIARRAAREAIECGFRPVEAEAELECAHLESDAGDPAAAEASLHRALCAAEAGRDELSKARAAIQLIYLNGYALDRPEQAAWWASYSAAVLERVGGAEALECDLIRLRGMLCAIAGDYACAGDHYRRALEIASRVHGPDSIQAGMIHTYWALGLAEVGDFESALRHHRREIAIVEKHYGPAHPALGMRLDNLARTELGLGDVDAARASVDRGMAVWIRAYGEDHPLLFQTHYTRALVALATGAFRDAELVAERSLELGVRAHSEDHFELCGPLSALGEALCGQGRFTEALPHCERAVAIWERHHGRDHVRACPLLTRLGEAQLGAGLLSVAGVTLARAVALADHRAEVWRVERGRARFARARHLAAAGANDQRWRSLIDRARTDFAACGTAGDRLRGEIAGWLDKLTYT